ncbi:MAG: JDVT-CTERM domain-containing protein, partial [Burkholderiaceae bacterium]
GSTVKQGSVTTNACPALPFTLAASQTCTVDVVMAVNSPGEFEATLAVTTNDQDAVITINGKVTAQATGGAGGGGCTMRSGPGLLDPMLILLSLFSLGVLIVRRKKTPSPFL